MSFDFQTYLQTELTERCRSNPAYSLRAFARDLSVEASALSKILNGKRALTREMKNRFGKKLKLSEAQLEALSCERVERDTYQTMAEDSFKVLSDWSHYAILELTRVEGFKSDPAWIARALGLKRSDVVEVIERLKRMDFIEEAGGVLKDVSGDVTTVGHEFTNIAFKNMQRQVLQKALNALDETEFERRDQTSMTMAIDESKIPQAREMLKKFRRDLSKFLESGAKRNSVYQLSLSLFPLTKKDLSK